MEQSETGRVSQGLDRRDHLLLQMYDQMFNDINRHLIVVWQSVGTLVGAFAVFALSEKGVLPIDLATALVICIGGWLVATLYDSAYWYNRNLVIIANIERQFLTRSDLKDIHYYFGKHRKNNKMITYLRIQRWLGAAVVGIVTLWHLFQRILPGIVHGGTLELGRGIPYIALIGALWYVARVRSHAKRKYAEFLANSPGVAVDTAGISYGIGHGQN